jgi:hypothetical protein
MEVDCFWTQPIKTTKKIKNEIERVCAKMIVQYRAIISSYIVVGEVLYSRNRSIGDIITCVWKILSDDDYIDGKDV